MMCACGREYLLHERNAPEPVSHQWLSRGLACCDRESNAERKWTFTAFSCACKHLSVAERGECASSKSRASQQSLAPSLHFDETRKHFSTVQITWCQCKFRQKCSLCQDMATLFSPVSLIRLCVLLRRLSCRKIPRNLKASFSRLFSVMTCKV